MRKVLHLDKQLALGQKLLLPALIGQLLIRKGADLLCTLSSVGPAGVSGPVLGLALAPVSGPVSGPASGLASGLVSGPVLGLVSGPAYR